MWLKTLKSFPKSNTSSNLVTLAKPKWGLVLSENWFCDEDIPLKIPSTSTTEAPAAPAAVAVAAFLLISHHSTKNF